MWPFKRKKKLITFKGSLLGFIQDCQGCDGDPVVLTWHDPSGRWVPVKESE